MQLATRQILYPLSPYECYTVIGIKCSPLRFSRLKSVPQPGPASGAPVLGAALTAASTSRTGSGDSVLAVNDGDADMALAEFRLPSLLVLQKGKQIP